MLKHSSSMGSTASMLLAAACWGFATVMTKGALASVPPLTLLVVQLTVSLVFLWSSLATQRVRLPRGREVMQLGLIGVLNPGIAYTLGLLGLTLTTASMSTLIWAVEPILILGLAWLILCERLTRPLIALSALAIVGVILVVGIHPGLGLTSSIVGNLLILAGVFCCALYTVLIRRAGVHADPLLIVTLQQTFAMAWALLIWPIELLNGGAAGLAAITAGAWFWAATSGIFYYALAFWFYVTGLKKMPASLAGLFLNLIPIFGVSGAYLFLGERLGIVQWLGAVLILVAVFSILRLPKVETAPAWPQ